MRTCWATQLQNSPDLKKSIRYEFQRGSAEEAGLALGPSIAKLRATPVSEILRASLGTVVLNFLYSGGTVDGWVIPEQPAVTFAEGRQAKVPVLTGSNADEGTDTIGTPVTLESYRAWLASQFDDHAEAVFRSYPAQSNAGARAAFIAVTTAYQRAHAVRALAQTTAGSGHRAYLYFFSYPPKGEYAREGLGSFHGLELSFVGGGYFRPSRWGEPDAADQKLVHIMTGYWLQFAATGDPNRQDLPVWRAFDPASDNALEIGVKIKEITVPNVERFGVFDTILLKRLAAATQP